jgi:hypothetical protein
MSKSNKKEQTKSDVEQPEDNDIISNKMTIRGCVEGQIAELKNLFSVYTTTKKVQEDDSSGNRITVDTGRNDYGEPINQCIKLYVDPAPLIGATTLQTEFYMGKDAALSTVATNGLNIINKIREIAKIGQTDIPKITRDDAADAWNTGLSGLTGITDNVVKQSKSKPQPKIDITKKLKAFMGNIPFIKAIMDSACLGESVCVSILYGLCESMRNDSHQHQIPSIPRFPNFFGKDPITIPTPRDKVLQFLLRMSYCDVFELVSSDVLGAVNGLYSVRAIHNSLPSVSYISIPKAGGGQIGTDIDVFIIGFIISSYSGNTPVAPGRLGLVFNEQVKAAGAIPSILSQLQLQNLDKIIKMYREFLNNCKGGICEDLTSSEKIMEYIKAIGDWFYVFQQRASYINIKKAIKEMYTTNIQTATPMSENIVWFSFQVLRYLQTKKVYREYEDQPNIEYERDRQIYVNRICQDFGGVFYNPSLIGLPENDSNNWYNALKKVAVNEAFVGHDNTSDKLVDLIKEVYGQNGFAGDREHPTENQLKWVWPQFQASNGKYYWKSIEEYNIKKIQKETECIFFQWYKPGEVLFSMNTNMVFNKTVRNLRTADGPPVNEIFMNNIGAQRVISTYDLENYESLLVMTEKAEEKEEKIFGSTYNHVMEGIVIKRNETLSEQDKILEIQGIICALDRASRTSHPRAIYCTGCLNIPIKTILSKDKGKVDEITTVLSYSLTVGDNLYGCPPPSPPRPPSLPPPPGPPGLSNYTLFIEYKKNWKDLYELFIGAEPSTTITQSSPDRINLSTETINNIAILISYLCETVDKFDSGTASGLLRDKEFSDKSSSTGIDIKNYEGRIKAGTEFRKYMYYLCMNIKGNPTKSALCKILLITQKTINTSFQNPVKGSTIDIWKEIFGFLMPKQTYSIGFIIVFLVNIIGDGTGLSREQQSYIGEINSALQSRWFGNTFRSIYTLSFEPRLSSVNTIYSAPIEELQSASVIETFGHGIGIIDVEDGKMVLQEVSEKKERKRKTDNIDSVEYDIHIEIPNEETQRFLEDQQNAITTDDSELLILETILSEDVYGKATVDFIDLFKKKIQDTISKSPPAMGSAQIVAYIPPTDIQGLTSNAENRQKLDTLKTSYRAIIDAVLKWFTENQPSNEQPENLVNIQILRNFVQRIDSLKQQVEGKIAEMDAAQDNLLRQFLFSQLPGLMDQSGGQPQNVKDLIGKVVIYKYDKQQNTYYITDYENAFKTYFKTMYGSPQQKTDLVNISQPSTQQVIAKGTNQLPMTVETPKWLEKLQSYQKYRDLSQPEREKIIQKYYYKLKSNRLNQMNEEQAQQASLISVFPDLLSPKTGQSVSEIKKTENFFADPTFRSTGMAGLGGRLTRRNKHKNKVTKRRINKRVIKKNNRKTRKRQLRRKRTTRRR